MNRFTPDYLKFARAVLAWLRDKWLVSSDEYDALMRDVRHHERLRDVCAAKATFVSFRLAQQVAQGRRITRDGHLRRVPYHCKDCGLYHIGGAPPHARAMKNRGFSDDGVVDGGI